MTAAPVPEDPDVVSRRLLAQLGAAMISGGSTVTNAEAAVCELGRRLGHPTAQVSATPTEHAGADGVTTVGMGTGQAEAITRVLTLVTAIALGLLVGSAIALPLPRMARRLHRGIQSAG